MVLAFGDCRLDLARRELRRGGEVVEIEPKAFDLLAFLVQHPERVVSKDDLLQAVWDGRIVSELALTTRISAVRRALGDDGAAQRQIRTFNRSGVRFVGQVTELPDPAAPAASFPSDDKPAIVIRGGGSECRSASPSAGRGPRAGPRSPRPSEQQHQIASRR